MNVSLLYGPNLRVCAFSKCCGSAFWDLCWPCEVDTKEGGSAKQFCYSKGSVLLQKFNIVEVNNGVNLLAQRVGMQLWEIFGFTIQSACHN